MATVITNGKKKVNIWATGIMVFKTAMECIPGLLVNSILVNGKRAR